MAPPLCHLAAFDLVITPPHKLPRKRRVLRLTRRLSDAGIRCRRLRDVITLTINGTAHQVDVPDDMALLWVLRDVIGLTGTKFGCGIAQCGTCTVHLDGTAARSCVLPVSAVPDRQIATIESMAQHPVGQKIQRAWLGVEVVQCGYCQSGQIMAATVLLNAKPQPSDADIDAAMAGNICRCGTYVRIREAIKHVAQT